MLKIGKKDVHLWCVNEQEVTDDALLSAYADMLSPEERARHERFMYARHRHCFLVSRALLRVTLSQYVGGTCPESLQFRFNGHGKPRLPSSLARDLRFNLSHTQGMVVLAVTRGREVGVDVEYLSRRGELMKLAERYFSPREVEDLQTLSRAHLKARFFELWTLKESYIKACGQGLSIPLEDFCFSFDPDRKKLSVAFSPQRNDDPAHWRFWQLQPDSEHKVALAVTGEQLHELQLSIRRGAPLQQFEGFECKVSYSS